MNNIILLLISIFIPNMILSQSYLEEERFKSLSNKSDIELKYLVNELLARHNHSFYDSSLKKYFNAQSWYKEIENKLVYYSDLTVNEKKVYDEISYVYEMNERILSEGQNLYSGVYLRGKYIFNDSTNCKSVIQINNIPINSIENEKNKFGKILMESKSPFGFDHNTITDIQDAPLYKFLFNGVCVSSWRGKIKSILCYTNKYSTFNDIKVGMNIDTVFNKYHNISFYNDIGQLVKTNTYPNTGIIDFLILLEGYVSIYYKDNIIQKIYISTYDE